MRKYTIVRLPRWVLFGLMLVGCAAPVYDRLEADKPHHAKSGFRNLHIEPKKTDFWAFQHMKFFGDDVWSDWSGKGDQVARIDRSEGLATANPDVPVATWIGHSTVLIQYRGITILTDPIFSNRASPFSFAGPRRVTPPAIRLEQLPPIDYVLISHDHYDHLDAATVEVLGNSATWLVPLNYRDWFADRGVDNVIEFDWWDAREIRGLQITATPSQHWTKRSPSDAYRRLWAAWSVQIDNFNFWFAGDTGYNDIQFREIGERLGPFDFAMIPIGAYAPRWFMKDMHVNPEEAIDMHRDLGSRLSMGIHWGAFPLTAEPIDEPPRKLRELSSRFPGSRFVTVALGESIAVPLTD